MESNRKTMRQNKDNFNKVKVKNVTDARNKNDKSNTENSIILVTK